MSVKKFSKSDMKKTQNQNLVAKLRDAIIEKRFIKTCVYHLIRTLPFVQKTDILLFLSDYFFGKKEIKYTTNCIDEICNKKKNEKIKVVFICWMPEMWTSLRPVYEVLVKNKRFEVCILAQPHITDIKHMKDKNPAYDFLSKLYDKKNVIKAYEKKKWFDLKSFEPDYVFYSYPYEDQHYDLYKGSEVKKYSKICLIQYGYNLQIDSIFCICHNFIFLKNVAIYFAANETIKKKLKRLLNIKNCEYPKVLNFGYSRFDLLSPGKQKNKKCILWTPRWTSPDLKFNKQSHFLSYYKNILNFAQIHPEIDIIIRPHPLMFGNFLQKGLMTVDEINEFKSKCKNISNVELDETVDYMQSLNRATIIISDFTALLAEYFIMGEPVIYCDDNKGFSKEGLIIDKSLYHEYSWEGIENRLNSLISGKDEKKEDRKVALKKFLPNGIGQVSNNIMSFLEKDYYGK